jgi:class 3 adenylate cyclase/tetratricopeptide (TPR) repeat protein
MKCPRCAQENPPQAKFCLECATPLALRCANCGTQLPAGAKFCFECATPAGGPNSPTRFTSPDTYTPKHLAERIINSKAALEGERKQVTVLFADLKGSMELLADRDPEEARKILDPVLEHMMEAVHRFEGTVNQVMGDGIMALFGAPIAHEDHAVRACYAALRMQQSVKRYGEEMRRAHGVNVQIRVGLNSGEVVVRAIGSDLRIDYTAVGQTTHLAARMEQLAEPGTVLLAPATLHLAEGFIAVKSLGATPVKGLASAVEIYELVGTTEARSRLHAVAVRGFTTFVGRSAEMNALHEALELAKSGHGQVVAVVGEPGVGKSRLCWEFTHSLRAQDCLVIEAASVSYGKATAYYPVVEQLKAYFAVEPRDDIRRVREKVTGKTLALDRALEPSLPALLSLLDAPTDNEHWERLDPPQRRQGTFDAIKRLLLRESQVQPLVVVFEDLHWIDGETHAVLDSLIESLPTARLLLLLNYRPEYQHGWGSKTYYRQIRVDPLPAATAEELLNTLIGSDPSTIALKRRLIARTEGNPFFVEESVRMLVESGVVRGDHGRYALTHAIETIDIPPTVQSILAARIDRLDPDDKRLLQAAAVIGKDFSLRLLYEIARTTHESLARALARLQTAEFVYEIRLFPDSEYIFKHALTHEVAYGSLLAERRRELHARIGEAIEDLYADRLDEHVDRLAYHAFRGELWQRTVRYARRAAERAYGRSAYAETAEHLTTALSAHAHLDQRPEVVETGIDLRLRLHLALNMIGRYREILSALREAVVLAEGLNDRRRIGRICIALTNTLNLAGVAAEAAPFGERASEVARVLDDVPLCVSANFMISQTWHMLGDYRRPVVTLTESRKILADGRSLLSPGQYALYSVMSNTWLAWCLAEQGEFDKASAAASDGVSTAEELRRPFHLLAAWCGVAHVALYRGDFDVAAATLSRGLDICRDADLGIWLPVFLAALGYARLVQGAPTTAIELLEEAAATAPKFNMVEHGTAQTWLASAYLADGRHAEAQTMAEQAFDYARGLRERGNQARALRCLAETAAGHDLLEIARQRYLEASALAETLDMRPLVAHCHAGLAKLCRRTGKQQEAEEHRTIAMTMYRDMGMTYWLEKAQREYEAL